MSEKQEECRWPDGGTCTARIANPQRDRRYWCSACMADVSFVHHHRTDRSGFPDRDGWDVDPRDTHPGY